MPRIGNKEELDSLREKARTARSGIERLISVCGGTGCETAGSEKVIGEISRVLAEHGITNVAVKRTGCHGFCEQGPLVHIEPGNVLYTRVKPGDVGEIVEQTVLKQEVVERLLYKDPVSGGAIVEEDKIPFYQKQTRIVLADNRHIDPENIEDYIARGGYSALPKALEMKPGDIVDAVSRSKIRGRGGGGFGTGRKWAEAAKVESDKKYVICNGDEGDPGAYMDRSVLEGNPHSVIEGMIIGGYAVGANEGYFYVRSEYPLAVLHLQHAIADAREYGILGKDILGTGFEFDLQIYQGAGAFVCGESSALIRSIEGYEGEPRSKHIHATEAGLWGKPTVLNNVETWANIPQIINKGADWFASIGTEKSTGTKIFSLVGNINNTGLVEVPMGISIREIVFGIGGGIPEGKRFKAVQTGGPSGGCLPESALDLPIDFDSLNKAGSIMGSGGMIVMDEGTCMVNLAKYFTDFNLDESCGKCTSCREGLYQLSQTLDRIVHGNGQDGDIDLLQELSDYIMDTSLCGLGKTAANPVLSTLRYFKEEYIVHIEEKKCPAKVCKDLISYWIDPEKCIGCGACKKACPSEAIEGEKKKTHVIEEKKCIRCGQCFAACPKKVRAVTKVDRNSKEAGA